MSGKRKVWRVSLIICLLCFFVFALSGVTAIAFAEEKSFYVCFSTQNYAVRNANKLTESDGEYILSNVSLSPAVDFYVTDGEGTRWYASDDKPLSVEETGQYRYDIIFSPDTVYSDTECHISYRFYEPASYSVEINGTPTALTYNPYHTAYDLYYISSELDGGTSIIYGDDAPYSVTESGYYRILFTPDRLVNGNKYLFDENGNYGSGEDFIYHLYIEDAPKYYATFENVQIASETSEQINGKSAYFMPRYENNAVAAEYRTPEFFVNERDYRVKYTIYEKSAGGAFTLIDDDSNEDTAYSALTAGDVGWHVLSTVDGGDSYLSSLRDEERKFGAFYLASKENGYGFDGDGNVDLSDKFIFTEIEDDHDDYDEDYTQYILRLTVTEAQLKDGDYEFYITDGKTKYKDGTQYITVQIAGTYKILFSEEHNYGRGRNFKYVLEDEKADGRELLIGTPSEFIEFAQECSASADYSVNLSVYLTADIDFTGVDFEPVKSFSGTLYGGYHILKNVTYTESGKRCTVFDTLTHTAVIERLKVKNLSLGGKDCDYAGFIGANYGKVSSVTVSGTVTGKNYVGGIVAFNGRSNTETGTSTDVINSATLENCVSYAEVSGESYVGGVCGQNMGEIRSCISDGKVAGVKNHSSANVEMIGGIAGYSLGKTYDCKNESAVTGGNDSRYVGGIVGLCAGEVYFSVNYGGVSADNYAGGIVGFYGMRQTNSDGLGVIPGGSQESDAVGSVNMINYTANYGGVTANSYAGGIVGNVGGLSNNNSARTLKINNSASRGDISVTAGSYAGGIVGNGSNAEIRSCATTGTIQAKGLNGGNYVGGVMGYGGSVYYSMSAATVKGEDYVGGIAGYAVSSLTGCYTNVLLLPSDEAENIGAIAGYSQAFNVTSHEFAGVAGNYYVGIGGGIRGTDYASEFDYAAAQIDSAVLASDGALSPLLCEEFSREYWQGGNGNYPTLRSFEEYEECNEFNDDALWEDLFDGYAEIFTALTADAARLTYVVTFLEWNKDNGELYDDDIIQYKNFDIICSIRVFGGQSFTIPALQYAEKNADGSYVYDGGKARYYASFPETLYADGNATVYAEYTELVTTVSDAESKVLAEGEFRKGTTVEIVQIGDYCSLRFTCGGKEISVGTITVKFFAGDNASSSSIEVVDKDVNSGVSGKYVSFSFTDGDYFRLIMNNGLELPFWAWLLIGVGSTLAVAGLTVLTVFLVKRKKRK